MQEGTKNALRIFLQAVKPPPALTPSQWADANRVLTSKGSAMPGRWKTSRTPYLREIMDCFDPRSEVQTVVIMKGAQIGATEAIFNVLGFFVDFHPCPIMYVMPTKDVVERNVTIRIDPLFEETPNLRAKVSEKKSRDATNTKKQKDFAGGVVVFAGANSPSDLRSISVRLMILDELSAMPDSVGQEGSPVSLAQARQNTFGDSKKLAILSTPKIEGVCKIAGEFEDTDQAYFFVPCLACDHMQILLWEKMRWTEGKPETVRHECENCGHLMENRDKPKMFARGEWRSTKPENQTRTKRGFHISGLYSPMGMFSWADAVQAFEKIKKSPHPQEEEQVFYNTILGYPFAAAVEKASIDQLLHRREGYERNAPPSDVIIITAGVDVQKDRLEVEILGHTRNGSTYSLDYRIFSGDTSDTGGTAWAELKELVWETWLRSDGRVLPMSKIAVDSGYNTVTVYQVVGTMPADKVVCIKGDENLVTVTSSPRATNRVSGGKAIKVNPVWGVGVNILKEQVYNALKLSATVDEETGEVTYPAGYPHFPMAYAKSYFEMLLAEEQRPKKNAKGYQVFEWVKTTARNEALDCRCYALAACDMIGVKIWKDEHWKLYESELGFAASAPQKPEQKTPETQNTNPMPANRRRQKQEDDFW